MDRRDFLKIVAGTGAGLAAGCNTRTAEKLLPYVNQPEEITPGTAVYYATTCLECTAACGVLARTREGRVVKLEGNPQHPVSKGSLCARGQAALQGLYNPDRIGKPLLRNESGDLSELSWDDAVAALRAAVENNEGEEAWLTGATSDSDSNLIELYCSTSGVRKPVNLHPYPESTLATASANLFGTSGMPEFHFEEATLIVSVNADFLETWGNPVGQTAGFTTMHSAANGGEGRAVYIGPRQSNTAACCDKWIRLAPGLEAAALRVMTDAALAEIENLDSQERAIVEILLTQLPLEQAVSAVGGTLEQLRDLGRAVARADAPLVIASGLGRDAELAHSLALLLTHIAGGSGKTLSLPNPGRKPRGDSLDEVSKLLDDVKSGAVGTLLIHEANPAFILPGAAEALDAARFIVYFGTQMDETAEKADLILPVHHPLESWGDQAASEGVTGLIQPVMKPIFGSRALADLIIELSRNLGQPLPWSDGREYMEIRLQGFIGDSGADSLRKVKKNGGIWKESEPATSRLRGNASLPAPAAIEKGTLAHFFPHPFLYDGRGADKPWLQEAPETSTSAVWGSWAEIHSDTAVDWGVGKGDAVTIARDGKGFTVPVLITAQVMPGIVAVPIGQGHEAMGRYATGRGVNPFRLAIASHRGSTLATSGLSVEVTAVKGAGAGLVTMAGSQDQGEREIAQAVTLPKEEHGEHEEEHKLETFYGENEYPLYNWGMTIDLDSCTGCGACVVACYAENNLGVVGEQWMREGREMSWIRIEKYADGDDVRMIPNLCQQCQHAPCEPVCPVQAAYHTDEGLNAQVYNRCVGTRYCSNNCPYKVRRFNWFDYEYPAPLHLQLNPDVSVRERGVMEKCTFCIQRIKIAKENAKNEGRLVEDGEIMTACQQTCPAKAITFGNLKDENSVVSTQAKNARAYRLLGELGTRPSITYLKKVIRNDV